MVKKFQNHSNKWQTFQSDVFEKKGVEMYFLKQIAWFSKNDVESLQSLNFANVAWYSIASCLIPWNRIVNDSLFSAETS